MAAATGSCVCSFGPVYEFWAMAFGHPNEKLRNEPHLYIARVRAPSPPPFTVTILFLMAPLYNRACPPARMSESALFDLICNSAIAITWCACCMRVFDELGNVQIERCASWTLVVFRRRALSALVRSLLLGSLFSSLICSPLPSAALSTNGSAKDLAGPLPTLPLALAFIISLPASAHVLFLHLIHS